MTSSNSESKRRKSFNFLEPSLTSLGFLFLVTLLFITSFFYLNFETSVNSINFPRWVGWIGINGSSSPIISRSPILQSYGDEQVGYLEEEGSGECDIFVGSWVWDDSYPLYKPEDCSIIEGGFSCSQNGRPNDFYTKWRWQPKSCNLPSTWYGTLPGRLMLEKLRNKRVAFVGDSLARNQWESLLCMLSGAVSNKSLVREVKGKQITRRAGSLVFKLEDFNFTLEYYRSPYLVSRVPPPAGGAPEVKELLKLDVEALSYSLWRGVDLVVISSGHWWTYDKTTAMCLEDRWYLSLGSSTLLGNSWHFLPLCDDSHGCVITNVLRVLNVTHMTSMRKDGHPSMYHRAVHNVTAALHKSQDCMHWCLPGVPDSWNELLYALLLKQEPTNV
ncbi:hypothetical protein TIFTF001_017937 [Ficus carica]|uniref:Trichome birefringence-like N-terminal domain-containing protein n=1 Tax=Ficus carica TaxID=3494 RepID=A0AA88D8T5_FICCA|nr:hypothetical protein TIFTF001_017937 [Ficus carica]